MKYFTGIQTNLFLVILLLQGTTIIAQPFQLPEAVTNHAMVILKRNNQDHLYTFYGLDSSKSWAGVHKKVFRLNLVTGKAQRIADVPDSTGKLAPAASVVGNKAYIVGGYAVYADGKEKSSRQLFIFDPSTETFSKGADLPFAIDDHVQAVSAKNLLYVISGWSDSANVRTVQVYDPQNNNWKLATPLPNEPTAAVFGGCGIIVKDTIYFLGGAIFSKFYPPSRQFYKGVINKKDPLHITWINAGEYPGEFRYRSVCFENKSEIYFWGGSNETYNYDGIAYSDKGPVRPNTTVLIYDRTRGLLYTKTVTNSRMDLRNIAKNSKGIWMIIGGMGPLQKPLNTLNRIRPD